MKKIYLVKTGFHKLVPAKKVTEARNYVSSMTGNGNYLTPIPTLAAVTAAANKLDDALIALDGSIEKTAAKNQAEAELENLVTGLMGYVQTASGGDNVKILTSVMGVRNASTPVGVVGPVDKLTAKIGLYPGTIDLSWGRIAKSKINVVQVSDDPVPANWDLGGETSKSKITIKELVSGKTYYFKVACITSAGVGPWSEAISCKAY